MASLVSTPMVELDLEGTEYSGRSIFVKRLDLSHKVYGGNKLLKLWPLITIREKIPAEGLVSMGGPHSNHVFSLAGLCHELGIPLRVVVRKGYLDDETFILQIVRSWGTELVFVDREDYRHWRDGGEGMCQSIYPETMWVPEGGSFGQINEGFVQLANECITQGLDQKTTLVIPTGTGGTAAGLLAALPQEQNVVLINAVPGFPLEDRLRQWLPAERFNDSLKIWSTRTLGRFGKSGTELREFAWRWQNKFSIPLDPVYTSRMMYMLWQHMKPGGMDPGNKMICLHTGGHAGTLSWEKAYGMQFSPVGIRPDIWPESRS